ncbi:MAG TPA: phosphatase PAP2 family protein [Saprospiraceae bacterium]|nr:phosphatase PAP2 family protein [Candidatus Parvibacillus calidus]MCC7150073.1 phosphatase PAP2 family protein [Saprospiraceae bacterium]WKZ63036.1 MAG: phosphatase PAP2 family protein [Saprospiraceae bacterium]HRN34934.1 phosphatase PAP2 family protein [Saprospiraceae bacterium]
MSKTLRNIPLFWFSMLGYFAFVEIIVLWRDPQLFLSGQIMMNRLIYVIIFGLLLILQRKLPVKQFLFFSILAAYAALTLLYKETALLNRLFYPVLDPYLSELDFQLTGIQPALVFSERFDSVFFSELMFLGYFSYYLTPLAILILIFFKKIELMEQFGFVLITSFLLYYLVFIFIPAIGPQFYFSYPDNFVEAKGLFGHLVKLIQENGEAPTAAFPSSHVGVALICMIWLWRNAKKYVYYFLPNVFLLILATVYIKAHYLVDVLAGAITAPLVFLLVVKLYDQLKYRSTGSLPQ